MRKDRRFNNLRCTARAALAPAPAQLVCNIYGRS